MSSTPKPPPLPVVLELAPLPREQIGPFLLLGVNKIAESEEIEANWAQRVIWARKKNFRVPLEDVNWARENINELEKRLHADSASLNLDTVALVLQELKEKYGGKDAVSCQPQDKEKDLSDYSPEMEIPDPDAYQKSITPPEVPREFPAVPQILEDFSQEPIDPWDLNLPE